MTSPTMQIFDRRLLRRRWQRVTADSWQNYPLLDLSAELLTERLADVKREFKTVLETGARSHHLAQRVEPQVSSYIKLSHIQTDGLAIIGDDELLPFQQGKFDLILSNMALHWINDLPGCLRQIQTCLQPDGLFLAIMAGGRTLQELRSVLMQAEEQITGGVSPRVSPMVDLQSASQLLQRAGFALPVVDSELVEFEFNDFTALMNFLQRYGAINILAARVKNPTRRAIFHRAAELYQQHFCRKDSGKLVASIEMVCLHGWKS